MRRVTIVAAGLVALTSIDGGAGAPESGQAPRAETVGGQQYGRLVIRNATLVNGRGTPAEGPVDIVIDKDIIQDIIPTDAVSIGNYGPNWKRPEGDRVVDARGMYVLPGLVDMHAHIPGGGSRGDASWNYA